MNDAGAMAFSGTVEERLEVALLTREPIVSFCLLIVLVIGKEGEDG